MSGASMRRSGPSSCTSQSWRQRDRILGAGRADDRRPAADRQGRDVERRGLTGHRNAEPADDVALVNAAVTVPTYVGRIPVVDAATAPLAVEPVHESVLAAVCRLRIVAVVAVAVKVGPPETVAVTA
jgi:hypothetical protein